MFALETPLSSRLLSRKSTLIEKVHSVGGEALPRPGGFQIFIFHQRGLILGEKQNEHLHIDPNVSYV
jgi:hypothetical protein